MNKRDKTTFILALVFALATVAVFVGSLFYVIHKGQSLIESHALVLEYQNKEENEPHAVSFIAAIQQVLGGLPYTE